MISGLIIPLKFDNKQGFSYSQYWPEHLGGTQMSNRLTIHHHNGICMIVETRQIFVLGREVKLSISLFNIFEAFLQRPEKVFSRQELLKMVKGDRVKNSNERNIDYKINKLRRALFPKDPELSKLVIASEYGVGYKLVNLRKGRR